MQRLKLADLNPHPRDQNITFTDEGHLYTIKGTLDRPVSTTETIGNYHDHFDADKALDKMQFKDGLYVGKNELYKGKNREEIKIGWEESGKSASTKGTLAHKDIENYFNGDEVNDPNSRQHQLFLSYWGNYKEKNPTHEPYRSEWLIYDDNPNCKKVLAGSIDFVVIDENGDLHLFDWKFVQELKKENSFTSRYGDIIHKKMKTPFNNLDDCNFNHYFLQLNFYCHILETLYGKKVKTMRDVKLHPDQEIWEEHMIEKTDLSKIWHTLR